MSVLCSRNARPGKDEEGAAAPSPSLIFHYQSPLLIVLASWHIESIQTGACL